MNVARLRLGLYLGALILGFVAAGLVLAIQAAKEVPMDELRRWNHVLVARIADRRDDVARIREDLAALRDVRYDVSLYDEQRRLIASSTTPALPLAEPDRFTFVEELARDGKLTGYAVSHVRGPPPQGFLIPLVVLVLTLIALVLVIVRQIGRPLQQLANAARRFGRGDLQVRADIKRNDELGEVGRAFDQMADRVTTLMTAQRELMANVSHELQTPLARIHVAVDLMLDGIDDHVKELLPEISHDLGELEKLIEDVMTLSRFELADARGAIITPLHREPTDVRTLVERSHHRFRALHDQRELVISLAPELPALDVDRNLMTRVFDNLLDNASKYSDVATPISLDVEASRDALRVAVRDRGIGIAPADLERLFTPFFRTDRSRGRETGGVGLGLVLAKRIVEAHGGAIAVRSQNGEGTEVELIFRRDAFARPPGA